MLLSSGFLRFARRWFQVGVLPSETGERERVLEPVLKRHGSWRSRQSLKYDSYHGRVNPARCALDLLFIVPDQTSTLHEPPERPLHHPA